MIVLQCRTILDTRLIYTENNLIFEKVKQLLINTNNLFKYDTMYHTVIREGLEKLLRRTRIKIANTINTGAKLVTLHAEETQNNAKKCVCNLYRLVNNEI